MNDKIVYQTLTGQLSKLPNSHWSIVVKRSVINGVFGTFLKVILRSINVGEGDSVATSVVKQQSNLQDLV